MKYLAILLHRLFVQVVCLFNFLWCFKWRNPLGWAEELHKRVTVYLSECGCHYHELEIYKRDTWHLFWSRYVVKRNGEVLKDSVSELVIDEWIANYKKNYNADKN